MYELMSEEFPSFDQSSLPSIPADWVDISWHNDACPSFQVGAEMRVYVDFSDPAEREWSESKRFAVINDGSGETMDTDNWNDVLSFIQQQVETGK